MRTLLSSLAALAFVASGFAVPAQAQQQRGDQATAREEMRAGRAMSLRDIERRVMPMMSGAQYLGPEYDRNSSAYRLKFIKEGQVTWVDVDARSGRVLRISR
jgi:uncharacterized membrane protein YkoI